MSEQPFAKIKDGVKNAKSLVIPDLILVCRESLKTIEQLVEDIKIKVSPDVILEVQSINFFPRFKMIYLIWALISVCLKPRRKKVY